jgi:tetratricopeptide (TPR) repeat protein
MCLLIQEERGDKHDLARTYLSMGWALQAAGRLDEATPYQEKAIAFFNEVGDKNGIIDSYNNIANGFFIKKDYKKAVVPLEKALLLSKELGQLPSLKMCYSNLADCYGEAGDFKQAYKYYRLYTTLNDSLLGVENNKAIAEMNARYESEKKDKEIKLLNKDKVIQQTEIEKQQAQRNMFIAGSVFLLLLTGFVYRGYRQKRKANTIISKQKAEVEAQKLVVEQQRDLINEKQKEIIDSIKYAKRIQNSLITNDSYIDKKLKMLRKT